MFRFTRYLIAAAVASSLAGFQAAPTPLPPSIAALMDDAEAARAFDYYALKTDGQDLQILSEAVRERVRVRAGADEHYSGGRCMTEGEMEVRAAFDAVQLAADQPTFEADKAAAAEALAKWSTFAGQVLAGAGPAEQPFASIESWIKHADDATGARERELFVRVARDQLLRHAFSSGGQAWGEGLSPGALARVHTILGQRICGIDGENTAWLKADIEANGWYRISTTSEPANNAAWLLTQHADRNPGFQREVLAILEPLVAEKETEASSYAYLFDRVAVNTGRPQRYGTQGRCVAKGVWAANDLEDSERVQALRDAFELGSLAEYTAHMHRHCADFSG